MTRTTAGWVSSRSFVIIKLVAICKRSVPANFRRGVEEVVQGIALLQHSWLHSSEESLECG